MRTSTIESGLKAAESRITADLMNAFLTERFFRLDEELLRPLSAAPARIRRLYGKDGEYGAETKVYAGEIVFLVESGIRLGIQWVQNTPIYKKTADGSWDGLGTAPELRKPCCVRLCPRKLTHSRALRTFWPLWRRRFGS